MRLANLTTDYWQLLSAEEWHAKHPDTFWIPDLQARQSLVRGNAAQLMFEIEAEDDDGQVQTGVERMWVIVSAKHSDVYIGILDNEPSCLEPSEDNYLCVGSEIPFKAEHIINIELPPADYAAEKLAATSIHQWPMSNG